MAKLRDWLKAASPERHFPAGERPLRSDLFSTEQMKEHGRTLALSHKFNATGAANPLLMRLDENERILVRVHALLTESVREERRITPASEWLLDNFYLIEEQIRLARRHLPKSYSRELPSLTNGPSVGLPRVYDLAIETISHGDGRLDMDGLGNFVASYQTVTALNLGELWAIPTMLRLALIENLRRVGSRIAAGRLDQNRADHWADRIVTVAEKDPQNLIVTIADMTRSSPSLSSSFVAEFARRLAGQGTALAMPLTWVEQRLSEAGNTIKKLVQAENQDQATDQVSISNSIGSLRLLGLTDWKDFVESMSAVEEILRADPLQTYAQMDFAARDRYRHVVERVARRIHISEKSVALKAIALAKESRLAGENRSAHVGFYLVDKGLVRLERAVGVRQSASEQIRHCLSVYALSSYAGAIVLLTAALSFILIRTAAAHGLHGAGIIVLGLVSILAASQFATAIVNWLATLLAAADSLPKMDFSEGIPPHARTLTVIPTILTSRKSIDDLVEALEVRFLANRDNNLHFALLTDFPDDTRESLPEDAGLLLHARTQIEELNRKYGDSGVQPFFLFHRPRQWNPSEGLWMGHERKRGKLADLNALLRPARHAESDTATRFSLVVGPVAVLASVKYVITLDTDTQLPRDTARGLVGAIAHPLNHAHYDAEMQRVTKGFGILQPRVAVSLPGTNRSRYARLFGNDAGIDPYTRAVSDVYQDVFGEGSFVGKGIYDVDAFEAALADRLPDNLILSHDLLEGCYARSGLLSDVLLYEEYPSHYGADVARRSRWIRGDWQIWQWLLPRVPGPAGRKRRNPLSLLSRWKIFDNLRRSLLPLALTIFLLVGWTTPQASGRWTLIAAGILFIPSLLAAAASLLRKPGDALWSQHIVATANGIGASAQQAAFSFACLPFEAAFSSQAIARTLFRLFITRKRLLEWNTSDSFQRNKCTSIAALFRSMWAGPAIAVGAAAGLFLTEPGHLTSAAPVLALWVVSPLWVWWTGRPIDVRVPVLGVDRIAFLNRLSRKTWAFFEAFVGPEDNWLPPDNFQEIPSPAVTHRTSPTNIGLALLANLTAYDFGYISCGLLLERTANTFRTMHDMERYHGHFYNWYDTQTKKALHPLYISTVDSGNLAGHLLTLRGGLLALADKPLLAPRFFEGVRHTVEVLMEVAGSPHEKQLNELVAAIESAQRDGDLVRVVAIVKGFANSFDGQAGSEAGSEIRWWSDALLRQCNDALNDYARLMPSQTMSGIHDASTLRQLSGTAAQERLAVIERLALQAAELAQMDCGFLLDKRSQLLTIGYNVAEQRADTSQYDLLASEARLATFVAIAQDQAGQESWFALGRLLTSTGGDPVLVSWSGSMFEYLMPLLVMPTYGHTLLDATYRTAVARQIAYGAKKGVPWGISECGYNAVDAHFNYQYRAFGVPGLGFKRGLSGDLVVAPYASALALMVAPEEACSNLQRLAAEGLSGRYGLYEAVDYTASRMPRNKTSVVIRSFMAHHQGMSFLSLAYLLLDRPMQARFESDPAFQSAMLLLQERIPRATRTYSHSAELDVRRSSGPRETSLRVFTTPHTPSPEVQLLSNGSYHVMVTNAGGGYSRWKHIAVTRWREDTTKDNWGTFCYIRDVDRDEVWSAAHQPSLKQSQGYEAIFSEAKVEFRRQDSGIDTHTEIAVSPEDDIELRRFRIANSSLVRRTLDVTSYAEVVLASSIGDALHPAFSNLFVQTEILRQRRAILCTRRPRSAEEPTPWMFHLMVAHGATIGEVSYETDRLRFIGRGRTAADPIAHTGLLSGSDGSVLDPIVAIRQRVVLEPGETVSINVVSGVAESRAACLELVDKYQDPQFADRTFDMAWTHSHVLLRQINASEKDAQLYNRLAGAVIYANAALRANAGVLQQNRRNQSGLWGYEISGDLPIVLLRIEDTANINLVRQMVQAHSYWRLKGLAADLMIWNEDHAGYRQPLQDKIMGLIASGVESNVTYRPGGILVRLADHIAPEDRILLQAVARVIIADSNGSLEEQLVSKVQPAVPATIYHRPELQITNVEQPPESRDLMFFNGFGGFTRDGREYVITTSRNKMTPAPWVNIIANKSFGTCTSEAGSSNTWSENAHELRLTPWSNDPVSDSGGEAFYIRDDDTGHFWSPSLLPCGGRTPYVTRHGFGYSVYEHTEDGIQSELSVFVAIDAPVKFAVLKLRNQSGRSRRLTVTGYVEWVMGDLQSKSTMHIVNDMDTDSGIAFVRNPYSTEFGDRVAFFDVDDPAHTVSGDRAEFIGRNGRLSNPAAMRRSHLSNGVRPGVDPCTAIQLAFELAAGGGRELHFTLGAGQNMQEARQLAQRFKGAEAASRELEAVWEYWNRTLGAIQVETPDPSIDVLLNGWLVYQTLACRFWARSGFYQPGGAFGFRDQLQDAMALIYAEPGIVREHVLLCAGHQFREGDVQHWWHPPSNRGVRTHCSDDFLWLPLAVCRYAATTGDTGIWDEPVSFIDGRPLKTDEESYYDLPVRSAAACTSLYDHCTRAIQRGLRLGEHGLPLMGSGDWNDGMNLVGQDGKGESVWLGFFLYDILMRFQDVAALRNDAIFALFCRVEAERLRQNIELNGWDGEWYRRAFFDDGTPLGSAVNEECQIDSIAQSWSVLSGAAEAKRSRTAMAAVDERLVRRTSKIVQLLDPPFDKATSDPGYIKGYVPGVRENGGQYTHAAIWAAMAFAKLGDREKAWEVLTMINPVNRGGSAQEIASYKVEPYVVAADVYARLPHTGRGGWTWYTGSAGWMYRLMTESLLGIRLETDRLWVEPLVPEAWDGFTVHYQHYATTYHITMRRAESREAELRVTLDGVAQSGKWLTLIDDGKEHTATMEF